MQPEEANSKTSEMQPEIDDNAAKSKSVKIQLNDMAEYVYGRMMLMFNKNNIQHEATEDINKLDTNTYLLSIHEDGTGLFSTIPVDTLINQMEKIAIKFKKFSAIEVTGPFQSSNLCSLENAESHFHANWKLCFQLVIRS